MRATLDRAGFQQPLMEQAKPTWALDPVCVLYLPFWNMPDGNTFLSQDAYGRTCTRSGATPTGRGGWDFDGTNDYVDLGDVVHVQTLFSVSWWTKKTGAGTLVPRIISKEDEWEIHLAANDADNQTYRFRVYNSVGTSYDLSDSTTSINVWHHHVATFNSPTMIKYTDGVQTATAATFTGTLASNTNPLTIGAQSSVNRYFAGLIGEVLIYNWVLSEAEVLAHYQKTRHLWGV